MQWPYPFSLVHNDHVFNRISAGLSFFCCYLRSKVTISRVLQWIEWLKIQIYYTNLMHLITKLCTLCANLVLPNSKRLSIVCEVIGILPPSNLMDLAICTRDFVNILIYYVWLIQNNHLEICISTNFIKMRLLTIS